MLNGTVIDPVGFDQPLAVQGMRVGVPEPLFDNLLHLLGMNDLHHLLPEFSISPLNMEIDPTGNPDHHKQNDDQR